MAEKTVDVTVIGGGIVGAAILYQLSQYDLSCVMLEKEPDIGMGTTKANSAILHAGFDAPTDSNKAKTNVRGNELYHELKDKLNLSIKWCGSLVAAKKGQDLNTLQVLKERGEANGVPGLKILNAQEIRDKEPNLSEDVEAALFAPTAGICCPFDLVLAFAENAVLNGAEIIRECEVEGFELEGNEIVQVNTNKGAIKTKYVVNAAGLNADIISKMAGDESFTIKPRKGEYLLFDRTVSGVMESVVFPLPTAKGKGILVAPTYHGNMFIGPNATEVSDVEDKATTISGQAEIIAGGRTFVENLPLGDSITGFAGLRAVSSTNDFILGWSEKAVNLAQAAGIQSPGLTAAPAIAEYTVDLIVEKTGAAKKADIKYREKEKPFSAMTNEEKAEIIKKDSRYGHVICRCETVTEGEIVKAVNGLCGARTVDGVKRRTRAGMGRCQGGFCQPLVTKIIARELGIGIEQVRKDTSESYLYFKRD